MRPWEAEGLDWAGKGADEVRRKLAEDGIYEYMVELAFLDWCAYMKNAEGNTGDYKMIGWTGRCFITVVVLTLPERKELRPITGWKSTVKEIDYFYRKKGGRK